RPLVNLSTGSGGFSGGGSTRGWKAESPRWCGGFRTVVSGPLQVQPSGLIWRGGAGLGLRLHLRHLGGLLHQHDCGGCLGFLIGNLLTLLELLQEDEVGGALSTQLRFAVGVHRGKHREPHADESWYQALIRAPEGGDNVL